MQQLAQRAGFGDGIAGEAPGQERERLIPHEDLRLCSRNGLQLDRLVAMFGFDVAPSAGILYIMQEYRTFVILKVPPSDPRANHVDVTCK